MQPAVGFDPYQVLQVVPTADAEVIQAAFRALARKYHPDRDQTQRAAARMAELNRAYAILRDESLRLAHDHARQASARPAHGFSPAANTATAAVPPAAPSGGMAARRRPAVAGSVLDFGRYRGWSLPDLARHDVDYLLWLSRHSSGVRYRTEIYNILRTNGVSAA